MKSIVDLPPEFFVANQAREASIRQVDGKGTSPALCSRETLLGLSDSLRRIPRAVANFGAAAQAVERGLLPLLDRPSVSIGNLDCQQLVSG